MDEIVQTGPVGLNEAADYAYPSGESRNNTMTSVAESETRSREIRIKPLDSGYLVNVGCQSIAVETTENLILMLNRYLTNPIDFESKYYSKDVRNRLDNIEN